MLKYVKILVNIMCMNEAATQGKNLGNTLYFIIKE